MDTRRMVLIGLILLCALGGTSAFASETPCPTGSYALYLVSNFTCSTGVVTFGSFAYNGPLNPAAITVTPITTDYAPGFFFGGSFMVPAGQNLTLVTSYFIDPPPIIHGEQLDLDPMGSVMLTEDLCVTAFPCAGGNALGKLVTSTGNTMASI